MFEVYSRSVKGRPVRGLAALVVFAALLIATGAAAFAAGPTQVGQGSSADPSASAAPGASNAPGTTAAPNGPREGANPGFGWGRRHGGGPGGQSGPGGVGGPGCRAN